MDWTAPLFRCLNPLFAREPLSGEGARLHGGRFNPPGVPTLYLSSDIMTALREANQVRPIQPSLIVEYRARLTRLFDCMDEGGLRASGASMEALAAPDWRLRMKTGARVPGHDLARRLARDGFRGLVVPSFASGVEMGARNVVLWEWSGLEPVDDESRLTPR